MKPLFSIFILSFVLNFIWENLHSFLYTNYMGGKITETILLRASIVDALIITAISLPFIYFAIFGKKDWAIIFIGFFISITIELYALNTGRWSYNQYMPLMPLLPVGLTPTIQLGFLGYLSFRLVAKKKK